MNATPTRSPRARPGRLLASSLLVLIPIGGARAQPTTEFTVRYESDSPPQLRVTMQASGLTPALGDWSLVLDGWGNWPELGGEYLTIVSAHPPLAPLDGTRLTFQPPADWDGSLRVEYTLPLLPVGSDEQRASNILPAADGRCAFAALANTILRLEHDGAPITSPRTITIEGPEGSIAFTGWAGAGPTPQTSTLPAIGDNAIYAVGRPVDSATGDDGGIRYEVYQFADGPGAAAKVLEIARPFVGHVSRTLDRPPPEPVRICVSPTTGGGFLTDHGLVVGLPPGSPDWLLDSPYFRHLVCHELFHIWLGHMLSEAESERTVWFKEGFTDYLSLRHGAACGVLPREWFVTRLLEIEQGARSSSLGSVAFADPSLSWRDGDGPNETMAYKGGAVLAFALDAELRMRGEVGLSGVLRDMLAGEARAYSSDSIRERLRREGLADFERRFVSGTEIPDVPDLLVQLGCERVGVESKLAYIGLRVEPDAGFGRIVEIDPDGPAAGAGFLVGDIIGGLAPARSDGASPTDAVATPYHFGLELIEPTDEAVSVWVHRGADPVELKVTPERIPGGVRSEIRLTPEAERTLFPD